MAEPHGYIPIALASRRLEEVRRHIERLKVEESVLQSLIETAVFEAGLSGEDEDAGSATAGPQQGRPRFFLSHGDPALPSPGEAMLRFIEANPGTAGKRAVRALIGKTNTKATDETRLLYSTLGQLQRTGKVVRTEDRRYYPAGHPDADEEVEIEDDDEGGGE